MGENFGPLISSKTATLGITEEEGRGRSPSQRATSTSRAGSRSRRGKKSASPSRQARRTAHDPPCPNGVQPGDPLCMPCVHQRSSQSAAKCAGSMIRKERHPSADGLVVLTRTALTGGLPLGGAWAMSSSRNRQRPLIEAQSPHNLETILLIVGHLITDDQFSDQRGCCQRGNH